MNLLSNLNANRMQAPQQLLGLLAASFGLTADQDMFETRPVFSDSEISKAKNGAGLVIGGYTIGSAVSADLFGHPAIRY